MDIKSGKSQEQRGPFSDETQVYFKLLLESCSDLILFLDKDLRITHCSSSFLRAANIDSPERVINRTFADVMKELTGDTWTEQKEALYMQAIKDGEKLCQETDISFGPNKTYYRFQAHFSPLSSKNGEIDGAMVQLHDVTDVAKACEEAKAAQGAAERASHVKSEFLSTMSHELRTPMNVIIGMSSIAKRSDNMEKVKSCIEKVNGAAMNLLALINDILDMSRIEENKFELSNNDFELEKELIRVSDIMKFRMHEKQQKLIVKMEPGLPRFINADKQRLTQTITNLLANAVKFTPNKGEIILTVKNNGKKNDEVELYFSVKDNGIGIGEEQREKLFNAFTQADSSVSRKFGGSGLGLAISKRLVEMMGGHIGVNSTLGQGSDFFFTIKAKEIGEDKYIVETADVVFEDLRILFVDDSYDVLEYAEEAFKYIGIKYDLADSGAAALEILEKQPTAYDLIYVDFMMDGMNGIKLTTEIRNKYGKAPTVVLISSSEWSDIGPQAKAAGVDGFLSKPLFFSTIIDSIRSMVGSHKRDDEALANENVGKYAGKSILLVEDIEINREIVKSLLQDTGLAIDEAENGELAYQKFAANPDKYDMIFMDVHMPILDGYATTRKIRAMANAVGTKVPIIAMTANVFKEDVDKCLESGMNHHLGKPLNPDEVLKALEKYLLD